MTEERNERERYSERQLSDLLNNLIDAWDELQVRKRQLQEFRRNTSEPRPPGAVFADIGSLTRYNNDKARYEQQIEDLSAQKLAAEVAHREVAEEVRKILPDNHTVIHHYPGGDQLEPARYSIDHKAGSINIRWTKGD